MSHAIHADASRHARAGRRASAAHDKLAPPTLGARVARGGGAVVLALASATCQAKTAPEPPARTALPSSPPSASAGVTSSSGATSATATNRDATVASPGATASSVRVPAAVSAGAAQEPPKTNERRVCHVALVGDSLTDERSHGGGYVRYLAQRCPESHFENFARGGAMVNQMRRWFEERVVPAPRGTFTHVVVFGGVNDLYSDETAGRTTAKIEADLSAIYAEAKAAGARVVALTVAPWGGFTRWFTPHRAQATRELDAWILAERDAGAVDVALDTGALLSCGDPDRLCPRFEAAHSDGLHFGTAGHDELGRALYDAEFKACR